MLEKNCLQFFGSELELSEIGYLALYFEMILRKQNSVVNGSRKQIAVVCTTGRGTAAMIIQQLRRVLGNDVDITQYSEEDFNSRPEFTDPEILRTNLASVILQMTALG